MVLHRWEESCHCAHAMQNDAWRGNPHRRGWEEVPLPHVVGHDRGEGPGAQAQSKSVWTHHTVPAGCRPVLRGIVPKARTGQERDCPWDEQGLCQVQGSHLYRAELRSTFEALRCITRYQGMQIKPKSNQSDIGGDMEQLECSGISSQSAKQHIHLGELFGSC